MEQRPYGTWPSPITPESLTFSAVGISDVQLIGGQIVWQETRPEENGRYVLVGEKDGEVFSSTFSARTRVHEYGGRCFAGCAKFVVSSSWDSQQLWILRTGSGVVEALTLPGRGSRFADPVITPDYNWVLCVRETHNGAEEVVNDVVAVPIGAPGTAPGEIMVIAAGHDFFAFPRINSRGDRICWIFWDHPSMSWDSTSLCIASFNDGIVHNIETVAGGPGESVTQPKFSPIDGRLYFISDRSGWWNLYCCEDGLAATIKALAPAEFEFAGPNWVFGQTTYDFLSDGRLVATWGGNIGVVSNEGVLVPWPSSLSSFDVVVADGDSVVVIGGSPVQFSAVVRLYSDGTESVLRRSRSDKVDASSISVPREVAYPSGGALSFAWYYPPFNAEFVAPQGERPPVVIMSHGGPTSSASAVLKLQIQYWTSRGFAVADCNYRGSSGKGREYRDSLKGNWGIADVEDCSQIVAFLASAALADPDRAVIRGGSAGGYTTLACLTWTKVFAAGASLYGVADLAMLAKDTHKFESRYLDGLVAPWPEGEEVYKSRSPLQHIASITCPIILFQGDEDKVVPRAQADAMFAALSTAGVPVALMTFPGEQHGFRQAATITTVARAELAFYGRVLGFRPAGIKEEDVPTITNCEALPKKV